MLRTNYANSFVSCSYWRSWLSKLIGFCESSSQVLAVVDLNGDDFSIVIAPLRSRLLWKHGDGGGETIISSYV